MKKSMRFLALVVSIVMIMSLLSACNNGSKGNELTGTITPEELDPAIIGDYGSLELPIDDKGTTITMLCSSNVDGEKLNNSEVIKELRRRTGLNVQLVVVPTSAMKEKIKVLVASKSEMPDIVSQGMGTEEYNDLGMQGAFVALNKNVKEMPNFEKIFFTEAEKYGSEKLQKQLKAPDGNVYLFPTFDISRDVNHGILYRKDILDKHNIPMWNGPDEFYNTLKKLKQLYPNSTPFTSKTQVTIMTQLGQSWGLNLWVPYYDEDAKVWKQSATDPKFKELLDFVKKCYDEKLFDPEFITNTQAAWTAKMTQPAQAFTTFDWIGRLTQFNEQAKASGNTTYDLRYGYPIGPTGKVVTLSKLSYSSAVKQSKNSKLGMKLLDYLLSDSGAQLMTMGIEGKTYTLNNKNQAQYIGYEPGYSVQITDVEEKYGMFVAGVYKRFDRRSCYYNYSDREQEAQDLMLKKPGGGFLPENPVVSFSSEEKAVVESKLTAHTKAAEEFATKYILGSGNETGDVAWNNWLAKSESLGSKDIIDSYNSAQSRYDAN